MIHDTQLYCPIEEEAADAIDTMETKYTDIIIYACGFLALIMATVIVVLCRMQVHPRREPFDALPVQKLSKFPLRRQVPVRYASWEIGYMSVTLALKSCQQQLKVVLRGAKGITRFSFSVSLPSVLGGVQLIWEVQRIADEGGSLIL